MAAYWGRVIRLTHKMRKRVGRAGNFIPTERLGRILRYIWIPVVGCWIVIPLVTGIRGGARMRGMMRPLYDLPVLAWVAVGVALMAFGLTLVCWKRMGKSWRMGIDPNEKNELVCSGPFAYVRHPIYALSSLLMLCTIVVVPSGAMLVIGAMHLALLQWEARREERHMASVHPGVYTRYAKGTGRFLPVSLRPYQPNE